MNSAKNRNQDLLKSQLRRIVLPRTSKFGKNNKKSKKKPKTNLRQNKRPSKRTRNKKVSSKSFHAPESIQTSIFKPTEKPRSQNQSKSPKKQIEEYHMPRFAQTDPSAFKRDSRKVQKHKISKKANSLYNTRFSSETRKEGIVDPVDLSVLTQKSSELQRTLTKVASYDPNSKFLSEIDHELERIRLTNALQALNAFRRRRRKRGFGFYATRTNLKIVELVERFPRPICFKKVDKILLKINSDRKIFPANLIVDKKGLRFSFFCTFDGRDPSESDYDVSDVGDSIVLKPPRQFRETRVLTVLVVARKPCKVMISVGFTHLSNHLRNKFGSMNVFSEEHEHKLNKILVSSFLRKSKNRKNTKKAKNMTIFKITLSPHYFQEIKEGEFDLFKYAEKSRVQTQSRANSPPAGSKRPKSIQPFSQLVRQRSRRNVIPLQRSSKTASKAGPVSPFLKKALKKNNSKQFSFQSLSNTVKRGSFRRLDLPSSPISAPRKILRTQTSLPGQDEASLEEVVDFILVKDQSKIPEGVMIRTPRNWSTDLEADPKKAKDNKIVKKNIKEVWQQTVSNKKRKLKRQNRRYKKDLKNVLLKKVKREDQRRCVTYLKTRLYEIRSCNRMVKMQSEVENTLVEVRALFWIKLKTLLLFICRLGKRVHKRRVQRFQDNRIAKRFMKMQIFLRDKIPKIELDKGDRDLCRVRICLNSLGTVLKRNNFRGKMIATVRTFLVGISRPLAISQSTIKIHQILAGITERAKKHIKRKKEIMDNLVYLWESERLTLQDDFDKYGLVDEKVVEEIAIFSRQARDNIMDIIYNSQLNEFVISKFKALVRNPVKKEESQYSFNPDNLKKLITKRETYLDFKHAMEYMEQSKEILFKLKAVKTVMKHKSMIAKRKERRAVRKSRVLVRPASPGKKKKGGKGDQDATLYKLQKRMKSLVLSDIDIAGGNLGLRKGEMHHSMSPTKLKRDSSPRRKPRRGSLLMSGIAGLVGTRESSRKGKEDGEANLRSIIGGGVNLFVRKHKRALQLEEGSDASPRGKRGRRGSFHGRRRSSKSRQSSSNNSKGENSATTDFSKMIVRRRRNFNRRSSLISGASSKAQLNLVLKNFARGTPSPKKRKSSAFKDILRPKLKAPSAGKRRRKKKSRQFKMSQFWRSVVNDSIQEVFSILFISNKMFKIEINAMRLRTFILSYAMHAAVNRASLSPPKMK